MRIYATRARVMLIGSTTDIRSLGQRLVDACRDLPETEAVSWPRCLHELRLANVRNFSIEFHLETSDGAEPKGNGFPSDLSKTIVRILAIAGVLSVVTWVLAL